jgi:hypothetical protein
MGSINLVWGRVMAHQGETFMTVRRRPFTYSVSGGSLRVEDVNQNLSKSTFKKALGMMPVPGPGAFNDVVRGPAYVWAILTDKRIHR